MVFPVPVKQPPVLNSNYSTASTPHLHFLCSVKHRKPSQLLAINLRVLCRYRAPWSFMKEEILQRIYYRIIVDKSAPIIRLDNTAGNDSQKRFYLFINTTIINGLNYGKI
jgi:hypothetical protein